METMTDSENCEMSPFDTRLPRTPYFVLPKLALQAMPLDWQWRFEDLLREADEAGLATPDYYVLRKGPEYTLTVLADEEDPYGAVEEYHVVRPDPWANYRYGDVAEFCPDWKPT